MMRKTLAQIAALRRVARTVHNNMTRPVGILLLCALSACAAEGIDTGTPSDATAPPPEAEATIKVVSADIMEDGQVVQQEGFITFDEYQAMHLQKAQAQAQPAADGDLIGRQSQALYVGRGGPGCAGSNCQNPNVICRDSDLWVYNLTPGWNQGYPEVYNLVIGCFRDAAWDYLPSYWQNNIRSLWGGDISGSIRRDANNSAIVSWGVQQQVQNISGLSGSDWVVTGGNPSIQAKSYLDSPTSNCGSNRFLIQRNDGSGAQQFTASGTYTAGRCTYVANFLFVNLSTYTVFSSYPFCARTVVVPHAYTTVFVGFTPTCGSF